MKRQIQKTGVRKFFGQDFIDLQAEPLKALDAFFAEYGACLIEGCAVTEADGGTFNVAPGLVALESTDPDSGAVAIRTMPFAGADGVALPLYLVAEWTVVERAYGDGKVKPIGYNLRAVASGVVPEGAHLVLTDAGGNRFVDAVQDGTHRFITDVERSKWNDILRQAKEYAQTQAASSQTTAVGLAKGYTDQTAAAVRDELALGDQAAVNTAKAYADRIVAALVDNSPELLNTLEELAGALGNDPNFATTVMTEIGKRATMGEVNTALAGKANSNHGHTASSVGAVQAIPYNIRPVPNDWGGVMTGLCRGEGSAQGEAPFISFGAAGYLCQLMLGGYNAWQGGWNRLFFRSKDGETDAIADWKELYHSGNFNPADKAPLKHTHGSGDLSGVLVVRPRYGDGLDQRGNATGFSEPDEKITPQGGAASFLSFGYPGYEIQMRLDGYGPWQGGWDRLYFRSRDGDNQAFSTWKELYHSGNLKIIRGSVDASGNLVGGGDGGTCFNNGNVVRLYHNLGHANFSATATVYSSIPSLYDNVVSISTKTSSYLEFVITEGPNNAIERAPFDFIIIPW